LDVDVVSCCLLAVGFWPVGSVRDGVVLLWESLPE
jgi:hypothetical protein